MLGSIRVFKSNSNSLIKLGVPLVHTYLVLQYLLSGTFLNLKYNFLDITAVMSAYYSVQFAEILSILLPQGDACYR